MPSFNFWNKVLNTPKVFRKEEQNLDQRVLKNLTKALHMIYKLVTEWAVPSRAYKHANLHIKDNLLYTIEFL